MGGILLDSHVALSARGVSHICIPELQLDSFPSQHTPRKSFSLGLYLSSHGPTLVIRSQLLERCCFCPKRERCLKRVVLEKRIQDSGPQDLTATANTGYVWFYLVFLFILILVLVSSSLLGKTYCKIITQFENNN